MATVAEIPTENGHPFYEVITWGGVSRTLYFKWNTVTQCWVLDIYDATGSLPLLTGLPMITGTDILGQFGYMALAASTVMTVMSIGPFVSPDAVPDFANLGEDGHIYLLTP
jgi:hypothetical protein